MSVKASSSLSLNVETGEADDDAAGAGVEEGEGSERAVYGMGTGGIRRAGGL